MCGIAGIYNLNGDKVDKSVIKKMTDIIAHRGPDDEGFYVERNIGFGHRRLSIIDLSELGHQPMSNKDGTIWITYNGEIYNYIEIREELKKKGYEFKSETDTEVIIYAYEEWAEKCLDKFNGMFAFAIWDKKKNKLFCARDRFGIKPFYYRFDNNKFVFASEIKALLSISSIKREPNEDLIFVYLMNGSSGHNKNTFFKNIYALSPGCYLVIERNEMLIKKYYDLLINDKIEKFNDSSLKEYSKELFELLQDSVKIRLRSDVAVGSCLSGGIDSASIVCLMNKILSEEKSTEKYINCHQHTFSSCFHDKKFDERIYINKVIRKTKAKENFVFPSGEKLWEELDDLIYHQEEPFGSTSIFAQWNVMRLAKETNVKVLLDGQGADEILAGYHSYLGVYFNQLLLGGKIELFLKEFLGSKHNSQESISSLFMLLLRGHVAILPQSIKLFIRNNIIAEPIFINKKFRDRSNKQSSDMNKYKHNLQQRLYNSVSINGLGELLRYEDKNSMAFSIETRLPFLDYRVVEKLFSIPVSYKIHNGWTKYLLRDSMKDILPEEIAWRRDKMGFVTSEFSWLRSKKQEIIKLFESKDFRSFEYVDQKKILAELDSLLDKKDFGISTLWRYINLELWMRKFF